MMYLSTQIHPNPPIQILNTIPKGKIGCLPKAIQEQVNRRLEQGESGRSLVAWLNSLPEVQQALAEQFAGKPIREQNLSKWRHHAQNPDRIFKARRRLRAKGPIHTSKGQRPMYGLRSPWLRSPRPRFG
jgi:hypothetical protein